MQAAASTSAADVSTMTSTAAQAALRDYEIERSRRVLKISVRSNLMGTVLQIPFGPVSAPQLLKSVLIASCAMHWCPWSMSVLILRLAKNCRTLRKCSSRHLTLRVLLLCRLWQRATLL